MRHVGALRGSGLFCYVVDMKIVRFATVLTTTLFLLVGCAPAGANSGADSEDPRSVEEAREDVCRGAAAIITANTSVWTKMRDNGSLGSFEWDAVTFWNQGDVIADFSGSLRGSAHSDDPNFEAAVNLLASAYSEFSSSRFIEEAGAEWTETAKRFDSISNSLLYALNNFEPFCR